MADEPTVEGNQQSSGKLRQRK